MFVPNSRLFLSFSLFLSSIRGCRYCVEHSTLPTAGGGGATDRPSNGGFADYASCNGPEADPVYNPSQ